MRLRSVCALLLSIAALVTMNMPAAAHAAGPRWVTAKPPFQNFGTPMGWYRNDVRYFVDQGPLSSSVDNSTAQGIVAAAASVWNIQYSNFTIQQGGSLAEDVSAQNVYLGTSGPIWPADVQSTNYPAVQIAVIFDSDGEITDMLLGDGSSAPANCRQNAVTESVDLFIEPGAIAHAVIVVNGRCTGPAAEQQLQLQYQLMRVFGRVIGLGWSQTNDNVFTGAPEPTYQQQLHWPIMHPIDIICGKYTYQCLPQPFTLRDDDRSAVRLLYGVSPYTLTDGQRLEGFVTFPTGQGMSGINMVARRVSYQGTYGTEDWETTSSVTGYLYTQHFGNPVMGIPAAFPALQGVDTPRFEGYWTMASVPVISNVSVDRVIVSMQPVNPLYVGQYSVGPFSSGPLNLSGSPQSIIFDSVNRAFGSTSSTTMSAAAPDCSTGNDGTESAPAPVVSSGLWSGRLCGLRHSSWGSFQVQAGRTATLEVTATDETGNHTSGKAHVVLGMWNLSDPTGTPPTVGYQATPFNGRQTGTTQMLTSFSSAAAVRFSIADERGQNRPDFNYAARLLYADSVLPARMAATGGPVRILGSGFQPGNTVTIGGVAATVTSLTSTEIDAIAPTQGALGGQTAANITVTDLRTGGTTTISGGLVYGSTAGDALIPVQLPASSQTVDAPALFSVRLLDANGLPVRNGSVTFRFTAGSGTLGACGLNVCTVTTDGGGNAATTSAASAAGAVTLQASITDGSTVTATFTATALVRSVFAQRSPEYLAAGTGTPFHPAVVLLSNGAAAAGQAVAWTSAGSLATPASAGSSSDGSGTASVAAVASLGDGQAAQLTACAWSTVCATLPLVGVSIDRLTLAPVFGDAQTVQANTSLGPTVIRVIDAAGHGVVGATVQIHQTVTGWQPPCPATGRCATPPVYGTSTDSATSDDDGLIQLHPLQYDATAAETRIVVTVGANGYLAFALLKQP